MLRGDFQLCGHGLSNPRSVAMLVLEESMVKKLDQSVARVVDGDTLHSPKSAFAALDIGATKGWSLIASGHLEVVRLGRRCTKVKGSSIKRLIQHGVPQ